MSANLYPHTRDPYSGGRGGPVVEEPGPGPGQYGSWNTEEPPGELEKEPLQVHIRQLTATDEDSLSSLRDEAGYKVEELYNKSLAAAISDGLSFSGFERTVEDRADDLIDDAIWAVMVDAGHADFSVMPPGDIVESIDLVKGDSSQWVRSLADRLLDSYHTYLSTKEED